MAFEFNAETQRQFTWLLARYPTRQAALLPALRLVEAQQGYVDQPALEYLAAKLELKPAYVYGVFTFYTHYRRKEDGKYLIQVCRTLPCALRGAPAIRQAFEECLKLRPGETTPDGLFTLRVVECLGSCNTSPVAQINDDYFENLTPEKVREIVAALQHGQPPPHLANGPSKEGGCRHLAPLVEATEKKV